MTSLLQHARRGFLWPYPSDVYDGYGFGATPYFGYSSQSGPSREDPPQGFAQLVQGPFKSNAVVYACEAKRVSVFSEARFIFRGYNAGRPGGLFGTPDLTILQQPWPRGHTGDLLANMILSADIGGTAYVARTVDEPDRLRVLRPDYVTIVMGDSKGRPLMSAAQYDADIIGFIFDPNDGTTAPEAFTADEVAMWAPMPDPLARFRGMSWMTPIIRDVQADQAATMHKLSFFENGATPQLVVSFDAAVTQEQFTAFVSKMDDTHKGWRNAYKTLYVGGGADVTVAGKDLKELDFSATTGKGETRIAAASGIHPVLVPLSEGMQGSSLNAGNYAAARRSTADTCFRPLWRGACGALQQIVPPPNAGSQLWYDEQFIPFLREDAADAANIQQVQASTIANLVKEGFTAKSAILAVLNQDMSLLEHTGLVSVQLQPPGTQQPAPAAMPVGNGGPPNA